MKKPRKPRRNLSFAERSEIAEAAWRVFGLVGLRIALSFDHNTITIRVRLKEKVNLDGAGLIVGLVKGYKEYTETRLVEKR